MNIIDSLLEELEQEYNITKKFIGVYPAEKSGYKPHEKSTEMGALLQHIVEIFGWPGMMAKTEKLDFADHADIIPNAPVSREDFEILMEREFSNSRKALSVFDAADLQKTWGLYNAGHKLSEWSKYAAFRHALSQIKHHRAQLGVYYRLNDINVPASYGPSADDMSF